MRESEAAQAELQEARKLLHMKEIYLRQLGAYHAGPAFSECDIQTLQSKASKLFCSLESNTIINLAIEVVLFFALVPVNGGLWYSPNFAGQVHFRRRERFLRWQ